MQNLPGKLRLSLAAAITLGKAKGRFYRNAQLRCINLLLATEHACAANCAFCGLARDKRQRNGDRDFIRVAWHEYPTDEILKALANPPAHVGRVCISMITHQRCPHETLELSRAIKKVSQLPVSVLISPTVMVRDDLYKLREAGVDRIGVAIDCATPQLFAGLRGAGVKGPHDWERYWNFYAEALRIFGRDKAGVHLICGLGETEQELVHAMQRSKDLGGSTHLFCFFPERHSAMETHPRPSAGQYRRIQLARYLIDSGRQQAGGMAFDPKGRLLDFGMSGLELEDVITSGIPFETSGCPGPDGRTACNRPYGNERPGPDIRNYPFTPEEEDLRLIREQLFDYANKTCFAVNE